VEGSKILNQIMLDNSKSKSGKHAIRSFLFQVDSNLIVDISSSPGDEVPPTYKVGESRLVEIPKGHVVYLYLVKNVKGMVKGRALVIKDNKVILAMNYRKLKLKRVEGDPNALEPLKRVMEYLKIPVKKINTR